jgi:TRAP-type C4-dicarboxylate transport system substrate-binding protein
MFIYKFQEVMKNYMIPEPIIGAWNVILVNMDVWKKMTPEQQAIIEAAVVGGGRFYCFNDMRMRTITSLGKMQRDFDVSVNTLPETEVIKMRKAAVEVWEKLGAADEPSKKAKELLYSFLEELGYK